MLSYSLHNTKYVVEFFHSHIIDNDKIWSDYKFHRPQVQMVQ